MRKQWRKRFFVRVLLCTKIFFTVLFFSACDTQSSSGNSGKPTYVSPSIDKRGRFRKGHIRMPASTDKNAVKNRNKSRYYYHTRGKYRRKQASMLHKTKHQYRRISTTTQCQQVKQPNLKTDYNHILEGKNGWTTFTSETNDKRSKSKPQKKLKNPNPTKTNSNPNPRKN